MRKILISLFTIVVLFFSGCEKKELTSDLTNQVQAAQNSYEDLALKPNECSFNGTKIETVASKEEITALISEVLDNSYSKKDLYLKSGTLDLVGVFKWTSCGNLDELRIAMDCEDRNPQTWATGYTGASYVSQSYNANLVFCVVSNANFVRTNNTYGILSLTSTLPTDVTRIAVGHDTENTNNQNSVYYNGVSQTLPWDMGGSRGVTMNHNGVLLTWFIFKAKAGAPATYPGLGLNTYGTLGTFCASDGNIYIDDQDLQNANWCRVDEIDVYGNITSSTPVYGGNLLGMMDVGQNTRYYMTF